MTKKKTVAEREQDKFFYPVLCGIGLLSGVAFFLSFPILTSEALHSGLSLPWLVPVLVDGSIVMFGVTRLYAEKTRRHALGAWSLTGILSGTVLSLGLALVHSFFPDMDSRPVQVVILVSALVHVLPVSMMALFLHVLGIMIRPPAKMSRIEKMMSGVTKTEPARTVAPVKTVTKTEPETATKTVTPAKVRTAKAKTVSKKTSAEEARETAKLLSLVRQGDMTIKAIGDSLGVVPRTVTRRLARLEKLGVVSKEDDKWSVT